MRPINKKAQAVMDRLTANLTHENSHTQIDTNGPDSGIMAVVVELVGDCRFGDIFSVAHYYEQNGDLMADPEMTFLKAETGRYFPLSITMHGMGVYREGVSFEDGEPRYVDEREQRDEAIFAGGWMENIKQQQFKK